MRRRSSAIGDAAIHFTLRIENFSHVRRAYGEDVARAALGGLHRLLTDLVQANGVVVPENCGTLEILLWDRLALGEGGIPEVCQDWLDTLCRLVPLMGMETPSGPVHLWLTGSWALSGESVEPAGDASELQGSTDLGFKGEPAGNDDAWAARYRADMSRASELLTAISSEDAERGGLVVALFWQPIRNAREPSTDLYHEALVRTVDATGATHSSEEVFCALERLGLVRVFDHYVVSQVIDQLESSSDSILGVNVSGRSMLRDGWWAEIVSRLRHAPEVASRLVFEITETAALPDISGAIRLATELRRCGCRIAIDDFGTGFASIRQLLALEPDIVKIDQLFLQRSAVGARQHDMLRHLVALAQTLAETVVIEGVETADQARTAMEVGGDWQQGYYWGRPSIVRSWRAFPGADAEADLICGSSARQIQEAFGVLLEHSTRSQ